MHNHFLIMPFEALELCITDHLIILMQTTDKEQSANKMLAWNEKSGSSSYR